MSLPVNNKGKGKQAGKNAAANNGSKFITKPSNKASGAPKKIMKTGGTRGS